MARFYVPDPQIEDGILKVEGDEVRHIRKVLRLRAGDALSIFDGSGKEYEGTLVEEGSASVSIRVQTISLSKRESDLQIIFAQSILKGEKMDYLIQKATELGVKRIVPFISSRSIPPLEKTKRIERHDAGRRLPSALKAVWKRGRSRRSILSRNIPRSFNPLRGIPCGSSFGRREEKDSKKF